jgi:hypothetical protein
MNAPTLRVPATLAGDSSEVVAALKAAGALWEQGNPQAAVRWLRGAADAARQAGDVPRATELAQAAGQIEDALGGGHDGAMQPAPGTALAPAASPTTAARPATKPPPLPPSRSGATKPPASPTRTSAPPRPPGPSSRAVAAAPAPLASQPTVPQPNSLPAFLAHPARVHVSVKVSVRDPNLLLVRPLQEGQRAPAGTYEAFLELTAPRVDEPGHANGGKQP